MGIDTHKYEHTAVATNRFEEELGIFEFNNQKKDIEAFIKKVKALTNQKGLTPIFGIEGSGGNGKLLTQRLIADYTQVYEVNPIFTKSRRGYSTSWDKSDKIDAKLVVSILTSKVNNLPRLSKEQTHQTIHLNLGFTVASLEDLISEKTRIKNQLHRLLHQEDPKYRNRFKGTFTKKSLTYWKNHCYQKNDNDLLTTSRHQLILWKINRLNQLRKQLKRLDDQLQLLINQSGQKKLFSLPGVGVRNAGRLLAYVKNVNRFKTIDKFCRYVGCVPEQKSSGQTKKHKRSKMSHRKLYRTIYSIMLTQLRRTSKAKDYYERKVAEGKTKKQARRCLMKRISCIVYGMMKHKGAYKE